MTEQKNNSGALFKSTRKEKDTDSDYNGSALISGSEFWINGWKNTSKKGESYLSLRFKPKTVAEAKAIIKEEAKSTEIPF